MPVEINNYVNAKIYKIVSNHTPDIYIGSTCNDLRKRLYEHKNNYKQYKQGKRKRRITSFDIVQFDDCDIILIEAYPCKNKNELLKRERHYIELFECVNRNIPTRTIDEYRENNKEKLSNQQKEYYQKNKDYLLKQHKEYISKNKTKVSKTQQDYYNTNKDKILQKNKEWHDANKEKMTDYFKSNKERITQQQKLYYIQNKEMISKRNAKPIQCDICNKKMRKDSLKRHKLSQHSN